ncbi:MAG: (2Fe-2S)-binding protein [Planctomycetes bacterium]|nr:(2Fe-2S)-binding protein [Planctomycetota bacterium]MCB9870024.1 (2Fe-2S)-binding protein [Planctomycetota bacterium]
MDDRVEVVFEPSATRVFVSPGATILSASEAAGVEIVTGCTAGMCGTDAVAILVGEAGLSVPEEHERGTLERMGLDSGFRLSCSARILRGPVHVRVDAF